MALVPVLLLGLAMAAGYRAEARQRGLAVGRSEALLVAQTAVEPLLTGPVSNGLTGAQKSGLDNLVAHAVRGRDILRLRLRDLTGRVVFSDDRSGFAQKPEDEALQAARGTVVERLARLNSDANDTGAAGPESVEIYLPLSAGTSPSRVGVLEMYLPYAPIDADVSAGLHRLYLDLALGLVLLYLALFGISVSITRGLRRQVRLNRFLAEHDPLTDLPNRALFHRLAAQAIAGASETGARPVIAIIDLDRFKEINDTLGHHNGDQLLTQLAARLTSAASGQGSVARLGGDEFGLILPDVDEPEALLRRVREVIGREVEICGLPVSTEASIGYAVAPEDGTEVDELLQKADVAMYVAKSEHSGVVHYNPALDHYDAANLGLVSELRHAIDHGELVLHYQPKAAASDGRIEAVEALVRWMHPEHGLLPPDRFIPLAEQTDLIDGLTEWVLVRALSDMRHLPAAAAHISVAVNVSARNLTRTSFAGQVIDILHRVGVAPDRLILEITETALLVDPQRAALVLAELASAGVRVGLDDFGIGQTSLAYLSSLPVHELKIDKSFVCDMLSNEAHAAIVRSIVELGHNLSLRVVAEGVETAQTLDTLRAQGCDLIQGYLLSRPIPLEDLHGWLTSPNPVNAVPA